MASGWGCQFLTKKGDIADWCRRLNHKCIPGCKGCILDGATSFTQPTFLSFEEEEEPRKVKKRSDNPLEGR
jgi:hypothetical protein